MSIYIFFRVFKNPNPPKELVLSAIDTFHIAILENLASKSCLPNNIRFRHDIFQYIFNGKGTKSDNGKYTYLAKNDFVRCAFTEDWDQLVDCMGDGVKVTFINFPTDAGLTIPSILLGSSLSSFFLSGLKRLVKSCIPELLPSISVFFQTLNDMPQYLLNNSNVDFHVDSFSFTNFPVFPCKLLP